MLESSSKQELIYSPHIYYFPCASTEQLFFEKKLTEQNIEFHKREPIDSQAAIEFRFFLKDLKEVNKIYLEIVNQKNAIPPNKLVRFTNFIFDWFARLFLLAIVIILIMLFIFKIRYHKI